ncbi:UNVERIFIED_CONTAM: hypothetical protein Sindi_2004800 [Sesamum indicum]
MAVVSSCRKTAGDKPEEGEDDVKSSCPLCPGRHTCYNGRDKGSRSREGELTPKTRPQFGLQAATRLHEAGIAMSNQNTQQALALPEKEVIQPHLPVRLPCYDFTPVTSPAFGIPLLAVKVTTSGMASSHSVTGGVYKARERIHRRMADRRLLAIPASCRRVAACNPN